MPVLFDEISADLGLSLVQVGAIWGIAFLPGLISGFLSGALSDKIGTKLSLTILCVASGISGASRGLAGGFAGLTLTALLSGFLLTAIPSNVHKVCGIWFSGKRLALANGFAAVGMALGFIIGSFASASILSPWLGGWQRVLFFYGGIAVVFGIIWSLTKMEPGERHVLTTRRGGFSLHASFLRIVKIRNIWILGIGMIGFGGCVRGMLGYLPLYLRDLGWPATLADGALTIFHVCSMAGVLLITFLSDKMRRRKAVLLVAAGFMATGSALLSVTQGIGIWVGVILAGMIRDGFMAVFMTTAIETDGIGPHNAGSTVGFLGIFTAISSLFAPPAGNSLAVFAPQLPFVFWAALGAFGLVSLLFLKEPRPT